MITRIIGLGSDFGDDRMGFCAVQMLGSLSLPPLCTLHLCSNPAADLLPLLAGAEHAVLIDAVADGGAAGRVRACTVVELTSTSTSTSTSTGTSTGTSAASSHGVSVASMLRLAKALGLLPPLLTIVGLTIDPQHDPHAAELSSPVREALPALLDAVLAAATEEVMA